MIVQTFPQTFSQKGGNMTTIKDIARISGYSISTVSRVINNRSDVSEESKQKIEEIIRQTGFKPNSNAKLLKSRDASSITILVKGLNNMFLEGILENMQDIFAKSGEPVNVMFLSETDNEVDTAYHLYNEQKPKGIIFLGGNRKFFEKDFHKINAPCVLVSESAQDLGFDNLSSYATDDVKASESAMEYFCRNGHTKIGIVGGSLSKKQGHVGYRRYKSATNYLKKKGIPFDVDTQMVPSEFSFASGYKATQELLQKNADITAIYAMSDTVAFGAIRAIHDCGKRIPEDISLIGFDGLDMARYTVPRLATIQQNAKELAKRSVEDLLVRIHYASIPSKNEMIPFNVIAGESVKNLKGKK